MNFTSESELNNALPFLDVNVSRLNGHFVTSVYRKPTFSGVYTNFSSYIPMTYKLSLVSTLLHRAYTICGNWVQIHSEISQIKSVMRRNGYPLEKINSSVKNFLNGIHTNKRVRMLRNWTLKRWWYLFLTLALSLNACNHAFSAQLKRNYHPCI